MDLFNRVFGEILIFVYLSLLRRIVIRDYLSTLSRPEPVVHFFRRVLPTVSKEGKCTAGHQNWVEAFARNHHLPMKGTEKGVRKEDYVLPAFVA